MGDEHITRAARALHENDCSCGEWDKMLPESRGYWLTRARVVLEAAGAVGDVTPPPDARPVDTVGDLIAALQQFVPSMRVVGGGSDFGINDIAWVGVLNDGTAVCVDFDSYGAHRVRRAWQAAQEAGAG